VPGSRAIHTPGRLLDPELDEVAAIGCAAPASRVGGGVALSLIRSAKDLRLNAPIGCAPVWIAGGAAASAEMAANLRGLQAALAYRGAVDFDDLIRLALQGRSRAILNTDRLRHAGRISSKEAQDSSRLQEQILTCERPPGQLVRVGDPNRHLRDLHPLQTPIPDPISCASRCDRARLCPTRVARPKASSTWPTTWSMDPGRPTLEAARTALHSPPLIAPTLPVTRSLTAR